MEITETDVLQKTGKLPEAGQAGGIIILEVDRVDYSLAEVAQIVEYNEAKVLYFYVTEVVGTEQVQLTLKVNTLNVAPILDTFIRYNYTVKNSFVPGAEGDDGLKERYGLLMKYLQT